MNNNNNNNNSILAHTHTLTQTQTNTLNQETQRDRKRERERGIQHASLGSNTIEGASIKRHSQYVSGFSVDHATEVNGRNIVS